ncbi:MAG: hypothetical protein SVM80_07080 [Halobacteriota archaeon]|nr:hypothetical protein [Halobacteriota archaeon]
MTKLGEVIPEVEKDHFKAHEPLPDGWMNDCEWLRNKDNEPSMYELFIDYLIAGASKQAAGGMVVTKMLNRFKDLPPLSILIEGRHPTKGRDYVRIRMSPFGLYEGAPEPGSNIEPDIIIRIDYYDMIRILKGEMDFMDPICDGLAAIDGNLNLFDSFESGDEIFDIMFSVRE